VLFGLCATSLYGQTHEAEPNDTAATATKVELGVTAIGELRWIGVNKYEADWWTFDATAGDTLRFVSGAALPSTSMQLYGDDGVTLLADEVRDAPELRYAITRTGTYFLKLSGVAENGTTPATTDYYEIGLYTNRHPKPPCPVANDREPNDIPSQARVVALGERVDAMLCQSGDVDYTGDVDYYRFHARQRMRVQIRIDRDTGSKPSAWGNPSLLVTRDSVDAHWKNAWRGGSVFEFWVPEDGDYYASVKATGVNIAYSLTVQSAGPVPPGRGEPVHTVAANLGDPAALAVASNGDIYVSEQPGPDGRASIVKVSRAGRASTWFVRDCPCGSGSVAFDAAGNLLVASFPWLYSVSPSGAVTQLIKSDDGGAFDGVAVAADGTIWLATFFDQIRQYSQQGQLLQSYGVHAANPLDPYAGHNLVIAPDGVLYFDVGDGIYRLVAGKPELFVRDTSEADQLDAEWPIGGFTFDGQGNVYVPHPYSGGISVYDRSGAEIAKSFAWIAGAPSALAFGRNRDGSTNSCLFVIANAAYNALPMPLAGRLYELNPSAVSEPGCPVGAPPVQISIDDAVHELLHPGRLSAQQLTALDQQGNNNGRYDIGDLRALVIANGALATRVKIAR